MNIARALLCEIPFIPEKPTDKPGIRLILYQGINRCPCAVRWSTLYNCIT